MTEPDDLRSQLKPSTYDHVMYIRDTFGGPAGGGKQINIVPANGLVDHLHAKDEILVREEYLPRVRAILGLPEEPGIERVIEGVVLVSVAEMGAAVDDATNRV